MKYILILLAILSTTISFAEQEKTKTTNRQQTPETCTRKGANKNAMAPVGALLPDEFLYHHGVA